MSYSGENPYCWGALACLVTLSSVRKEWKVSVLGVGGGLEGGLVSCSRAGPGTHISLNDTGQWAQSESYSSVPFLESQFMLL